MSALIRLTSPVFSHQVAHGFFGRTGGVSSGDYDSLNCGPGSGDLPENICRNRGKCLNVLGEGCLVTGYQTHSAEAVFLEDVPENQPQADALVTATPHIAIGILTADCMPVLFHDPVAKIIGAAHAGWRGALGGILENCIAVMRDAGATPENIHAVFGPCLQRENFEVGLELLDQFTEQFPEAHQFFFPSDRGDKKFLDLRAFGFWRLRRSGLVSAHMDSLPVCTLGEPEHWFSYRFARRQQQQDYGRNLSAIMLTSTDV